MLTIISLSSAFTAVFISSGVLEGFKATLINGEVDTNAHLRVKPEKKKKKIENVSEVAEYLSRIKEVESYSIRNHGQADFEYDNRISRPYAILGVDVFNEIRTSKVSERIIHGRFIDPHDTKSVALGITFADALEGLAYDGKMIRVGEQVKIRSVEGEWENYTVVGIFDAKNFLSNWWAVLPKKETERIDGRGKDSEIVVRLKDSSRMEDVRRLIQNQLQGIAVFTWEDEAGYIKDIIAAVVFITGSITNLLIETTFVIMSVIIFINVFQRRRQIGILKSMGASNRFVVAIYIFETFVYASLSYFIGFLLFMLLNIYSTNHPINLLIGDFHTVFVEREAIKLFFILVGASLAGSIIPSYIAAKTRIADVIRNAI